MHLTVERNTAHPSNNTGPDFGRPGAPAHLDPGSDAQPLSGPLHALARGIFAFGGEPGSTFAEADQNNTIVRVYDGPNLLCTLSGFVNHSPP